MPERVYLFDVDGTLTEPRQLIEPEIEDTFIDWVLSKNKKVYLVTGSDVEKTKEQLSEDLMDACLGVFTCSGNVFRQDDKIVYSNVFDPSEEFLEDLQLIWTTLNGEPKKEIISKEDPG